MLLVTSAVVCDTSWMLRAISAVVCSCLADGLGDSHGDVADLGDGAFDAGNFADRLLGVEVCILAIEMPMVVVDLPGLVGQALDLAGHHGEALTGLPCPRRLDGGV